MTDHDLLNLLNELGKREHFIEVHSLILICTMQYFSFKKEEYYEIYVNEFNTFNNTRARMLDSTYHMTLKSLFLRIKMTTLLWTS